MIVSEKQKQKTESNRVHVWILFWTYFWMLNVLIEWNIFRIFYAKHNIRMGATVIKACTKKYTTIISNMKSVGNRRKEEHYNFIRRLLSALHSWIISSSSSSSSKVKLSLSKMVSTCNIIHQINSKNTIPIGTYITKIKSNKSILAPKKQAKNIGFKPFKTITTDTLTCKHKNWAYSFSFLLLFVL